MASIKKQEEFVDFLDRDISDEVGNGERDEIADIADRFDQVLTDAINTFNSGMFDKDGFIAKLQNMEFDNKADADSFNRILNNLKSDFNDINAINNSDMMTRRNIHNICEQMPEMRDCIYIVRDAIIETDAVTGGVSRKLSFGSTSNESDDDSNIQLVKDLEEEFDLQLATKNFIIPRGLTVGETYINVIPYSKLFAELAAKNDKDKYGLNKRQRNKETVHTEMCHSLYTEDNMQYMKESVSSDAKDDIAFIEKLNHPEKKPITANEATKISDDHLKAILESIDVYSEGTSVLYQELGAEGIKEILEHGYVSDAAPDGSRAFFEDVVTLNGVSPEDVDYNQFKDIKGCYLKYLDPLKLIPVKLDRKVIGYYYVTTQMDMQMNPTSPNGIMDISFQHYTKDKNLVANLANVIIKSFNKELLEKNANLKSEIAEIIMAHKFNESKLSFLFIPETEVVRIVVNEDENGKGHSIIEPSLFPASMYLLLILYNMLYILNNNTTRVHWLMSSGLNKNYSAQIQRAIRKFQSRRITIDDVYSYSGTLNKIGGIGEMIMPAGRGDFKALTTDTIPAVDMPINMDFIEMIRRQAISGTSVPALMVINAIDEVDFAKTIELANTRFLSAVGSYKIDFNKGMTRLYQTILRYNSDLDDSTINQFRYSFNQVQKTVLEITNDMVQNFNTVYEVVSSIYYSQDDLVDADGKPTNKSILLKKKLAQKYLPQLEFDELDAIIAEVNVDANKEVVQKQAADAAIKNEDVDKIDTNPDET